MITLESVLLEAENIDGSPEAASEEEDNANTDYTDTGDEETDADPADNDAPADDDAGAEDDPGPEEGTDYTEEDEGATDDGSGDGAEDDPDAAGDTGGMDDGSSGDSSVESEDQIKARDTKVKNLRLLQNMNRLYHTVKGYIYQVTNLEKQNILFSAIQKTVIGNFRKLCDLIYDYIIYYYDHMSYEYNMYTFQYFVEICKINIEMLNKISAKDDVKY